MSTTTQEKLIIKSRSAYTHLKSHTQGSKELDGALSFDYTGTNHYRGSIKEATDPRNFEAAVHQISSKLDENETHNKLKDFHGSVEKLHSKLKESWKTITESKVEHKGKTYTGVLNLAEHISKEPIEVGENTINQVLRVLEHLDRIARFKQKKFLSKASTTRQFLRHRFEEIIANGNNSDLNYQDLSKEITENLETLVKEDIQKSKEALKSLKKTAKNIRKELFKLTKRLFSQASNQSQLIEFLALQLKRNLPQIGLPSLRTNKEISAYFESLRARK